MHGVSVAADRLDVDATTVVWRLSVRRVAGQFYRCRYEAMRRTFRAGGTQQVHRSGPARRVCAPNDGVNEIIVLVCAARRPKLARASFPPTRSTHSSARHATGA